MAWLLAIFLIPFVGILLFLLIGNVRSCRRSGASEQARGRRLIRERSDGVDLRRPTRRRGRAWFAAVVRAEPATSARCPRIGGNTRDASSATTRRRSTRWPPTIDTAERFVHVEFFIVSLDDTTRGVLRRDGARRAARRRGAAAARPHRLAARSATRKATFAELDRIGVKWSCMLPVQPFKGKYQRPDLRNHRKIVVVDGRVGVHGLAEPHRPHLQLAEEHQARAAVAGARGPRRPGPIVTALNAMFLSDWYIETDELLADDENVPRRPRSRRRARPMRWSARSCRAVPAYDGENNLRLFLVAHATARPRRSSSRARTSCPTRRCCTRSRRRCQRGLDVQLFVSEIGDQGSVWHAQRSYYERPAAGRRADLALPGAVHPARQALLDRRRRRGHRLEQHGHPLVQPQHGGLAARARRVVRRARCARSRRATARCGRELTLEEWQQRAARSATFLDGLARLTSALQ